MKFLRPWFFSSRFYALIWSMIILFVLGYFFFPLFVFAKIVLGLFAGLVCFDIYLLGWKGTADAERALPARFSNGDQNSISIKVKNSYPFTVSIKVIDELPEQFQLRDFTQSITMRPHSVANIEYSLRPHVRGEYVYESINVFVTSPLKLAQKKFSIPAHAVVPAYPSFMQMKKFELLALSNRLTETGIKKVRQIGRSLEFDQIREYVTGDDFRTLNWKATARRNKLMVNQFMEEKAQQIYTVIDMSRAMKMPFDGLTLLDHSINATLAFSRIVLQKRDRAGLVTFSNKLGMFLPADDKISQMGKIMEGLYHQATDFTEADYELLFTTLLSKLRHRSLIMLHTNFESLESMKRQLPFLRKLAKNHIVVVIFFENTELHGILESEPKDLESIYVKAIAEKFAYEKKQIVKELQLQEIHALLTPPKALSVNTINTYFGLKARNLI